MIMQTFRKIKLHISLYLLSKKGRGVIYVIAVVKLTFYWTHFLARILARMSRGCYEETDPVELQLYGTQQTCFILCP